MKLTKQKIQKLWEEQMDELANAVQSIGNLEETLEEDLPGGFWSPRVGQTVVVAGATRLKITRDLVPFRVVLEGESLKLASLRHFRGTTVTQGDEVTVTNTDYEEDPNNKGRKRVIATLEVVS